MSLSENLLYKIHNNAREYPLFADGDFCSFVWSETGYRKPSGQTTIDTCILSVCGWLRVRLPTWGQIAYNAILTRRQILDDTFIRLQLYGLPAGVSSLLPYDCLAVDAIAIHPTGLLPRENIEASEGLQPINTKGALVIALLAICGTSRLPLQLARTKKEFSD